jgi:hypothetical protein
MIVKISYLCAYLGVLIIFVNSSHAIDFWSLGNYSEF